MTAGSLFIPVGYALTPRTGKKLSSEANGKFNHWDLYSEY